MEGVVEETSPGFVTLAAKVAYNGAPFNGFARQPGMRTVQGQLEDALATYLRHPIPTVCAGRTDAGVHARGQIISFDVPEEVLDGRPPDAFLRPLNALTDPAIAVRSVWEAPRGFSARFDAKAREYRYFIATGSTPPIFMRDFSWFCNRPLDVEAMESAGRRLIGEHDFKSFCTVASAIGKPTCRNLLSLSFSRQEVMGEPVVVMDIVGSSFLHSMVRTIMGTLMMVGRGLREAEWVSDVLHAKDRCAAGENAPAKGLVFWDVRY